MSSPERPPSEAGFTLVEMLVALAIFSLAALALLRLEGATVSNTARLQDQALARIVAQNLAVETMTDPVPPAFGRQSGTVVNGGRNWTWVRDAGRSPERRRSPRGWHRTATSAEAIAASRCRAAVAPNPVMSRVIAVSGGWTT